MGLLLFFLKYAFEHFIVDIQRKTEITREMSRKFHVFDFVGSKSKKKKKSTKSIKSGLNSIQLNIRMKYSRFIDSFMIKCSIRDFI